MPIDVHAHFYPPALVDSLRRRGGPSDALADRLDAMGRRNRAFTGGLDERLAFLASLGIRQLLSIPYQAILLPDRAASRDNVATANDTLAEVVIRSPRSFGLFASLPLVDPEAALAELERCSTAYPVVGVIFPTHILGRRLDWEELEPLYAEIERRELPIFLHPGPPPHAVAPNGYTDCGLESGLYYPAEDAHALLRLVARGVLERHPRLRVICPHLGGPIAFLFARLEHGLQPDLLEGRSLPHPPSHYLKTRVLYDTVSQHLPAVQCACETFGVGRLVFGTDFPYTQEVDIRANLATIDALDITPAERQGILEDNVRAWIPG